MIGSWGTFRVLFRSVGECYGERYVWLPQMADLWQVTSHYRKISYHFFIYLCVVDLNILKTKLILFMEIRPIIKTSNKNCFFLDSNYLWRKNKMHILKPKWQEAISSQLKCRFIFRTNERLFRNVYNIRTINFPTWNERTVSIDEAEHTQRLCFSINTPNSTNSS